MTQTPVQSRKWQKALLVGSLALNLVVVGVIAGAFFNGGGHRNAARFDLTAGPLTRAMDSEHRDAVRAALRQSDAFRGDNRRAMRADMQALIATLRADDFDSEAFKNIMMRQRERLAAGQNTVVEVVSAQIEGMSAQDRAGFADRLETQLRNGPPPRRSDN